MPLIECHDVGVRYDRSAVLEHVNFSVEPGEFICIVGENGSGKSTLMKGILGLRPIQGTVKFGDGLRKNQIGYLPQQSAVQRDFPASVLEITLSGCLSGKGFQPFYRKEDKARAEENLREMSMWQFRKRAYRELSGGQQQRVLLARALCATDKLLMLDEPVTGLDPAAAAGLYHLLERLNKQKKAAVVMVTHDLSSLQLADKVLHLDREPVFFGTKEDYWKSGASQRLTGGRTE